MSTGGPALSLAELQAHDPDAHGSHTGERRYLCPLPGVCSDKQDPHRHRTLSVNMATGEWHCHRCGTGGLLSEHWQDRPRMSRGERGRRHLRQVCGLPPAPIVKQAPNADMAAPIAATAATAERKAQDWRRHLDGLRPLPDTPGAEYLARRGIPAELARAAGARYSLDWYGRPAVVFPVRDLEGRLVAAQGRHTDGRDDPKARSAGPIGAGLFSTPDALDADPVILAEAPIDALSLAAAGYPAVALCGTAPRPWMPPVLSWRRVLLAFDADEAGDKAAAEWTAALRYGTRCERLRPEGAKDWNALLLAAGPDALRAALAPAITPEPTCERRTGRCLDCGAPVTVGDYCPRHDPFGPDV